MNGSRTTWTRRKALQIGALTSAALALPRYEVLGQSQGSARKGPNVVFLVADGMSAGVPPMAQAFSQLVRNKGTFWQKLAEDTSVTQGYFNMASMSSMVTDSAAAASSWGSGQRVMNRVLNQYPDGTVLKTLCKVLQENGQNTGLVSTARITHATPAGFFASVPLRDQEDVIARQYLDNGPMVLLGGGLKFFTPSGRSDKTDILPQFRSQGYQVVQSRDDLLKIGSGKILGIFGDDHLPYTLDQRAEPALMEKVPTLAEMSQTALRTLSDAGKPFFLMIEAAKVDMAAHANDAAGLLWDQLAFDDAIGVVLEFQKQHPDTLVIVSSDHGNANPGENGMGHGYDDSTPCFERLKSFKRTSSWVRTSVEKQAPGKNVLDPAFVVGLVKEASGFEISRENAQGLLDPYQKKPVPDFSVQQQNFYGVLGQLMGNYTGVGWTGVTHTSDWTQRLAKGPHQEKFAGLIRNTDFFYKVLEIAGVSFENPPYKGIVPKKELPPISVADPTG